MNRYVDKAPSTVRNEIVGCVPTRAAIGADRGENEQRAHDRHDPVEQTAVPGDGRGHSSGWRYPAEGVTTSEKWSPAP